MPFARVVTVCALTAIACLPITVYSQPSSPLAVPGVPINLTPQVNGSTVALMWLPGDGSTPTAYIVEAALAANGPAIASLPAGEPGLIVTAVPDGVYFVRVRGINADGAGPPSTEVPVVVGDFCGSIPEPPTGLAHTATLGIVSLSWSPPANGCRPTHYVLHAGTSPGASNVTALNVGAQTTFVTAAPPGTYYVRAQAVNAIGSSRASNESVVAVGPSCIVPGAPRGFSAAAIGSAATFAWQPPDNGGVPTAYQLEAGRGPTSSDIAVLPVAGLSYYTPAPAGSYHVRVRARNACGAGPSSDTVLLTIVCVPPGTPGTPSPNVTGTTATLSWAPAGGATSYRIEVGTAAGASNVAARTVAGTSAQVMGLAAGTYFTRVRALNSCGSGANSGEAIFTISPPPSSRSCGGAPAPGSVACGAPTARCTDGSWSCSQNRSGTCSHHSGVSCWVCPGPLC